MSYHHEISGRCSFHGWRPLVVARKSMPEGALVVVSAGDNAKNAEIAAKEGCDVCSSTTFPSRQKFEITLVPIFSSFS